MNVREDNRKPSPHDGRPTERDRSPMRKDDEGKEAGKEGRARKEGLEGHASWVVNEWLGARLIQGDGLP